MSNKHGTPLNSILPAPVYGALKGMVSNWVDADRLILPADQSVDDDNRKYVSVATCEKEFSIKRHTLWRLVKRGLVEAHKTGPARSARVLVVRKSLERYLRSNAVDPRN